MERCANCDSPIGKLETPHVFNGEVVCATCHRKLNKDESTDDLVAAIQKEAGSTLNYQSMRDEDRSRMMRSSRVAGSSTHVHSVELTSKKWKRKWVNGIIVMFASMVFFAPGAAMQVPMLFVPGAIVLIIGICMCISARAGAWWDHG